MRPTVVGLEAAVAGTMEGWVVLLVIPGPEATGARKGFGGGKIAGGMLLSSGELTGVVLLAGWGNASAPDRGAVVPGGGGSPEGTERAGGADGPAPIWTNVVENGSGIAAGWITGNS